MKIDKDKLRKYCDFTNPDKSEEEKNIIFEDLLKDAEQNEVIYEMIELAHDIRTLCDDRKMDPVERGNLIMEKIDMLYKIGVDIMKKAEDMSLLEGM